MKFYQMIILLGFLACTSNFDKAEGQKTEEAHENKIGKKVELNSKTIDRKIEADSYACITSVVYPEIINGDSFCKALNDSIHNFVLDIVTKHEAICKDGEIDIEIEHDPEETLKMTYEGGINEHYLSIILQESSESLGTTRVINRNYSYNYDLQTQQPVLLSDFIKIDEHFEQLFFENLKLESSYTEEEEMILKKYFKETPEIQYKIDQDWLSISLDPYIDGLNINMLGGLINIDIEELLPSLLVKKEELPSAVN